MNFDNEQFIAELPSVQLPINTDKNFRAYTVTNLEMTDHDQGLYPKDVVIGEFVPTTIYKKLNNGCMALVLVNHQLILRRLYITKNKLTFVLKDKSIFENTFSPPISH